MKKTISVNNEYTEGENPIDMVRGSWIYNEKGIGFTFKEFKKNKGITPQFINENMSINFNRQNQLFQNQKPITQWKS